MVFNVMILQLVYKTSLSILEVQTLTIWKLGFYIMRFSFSSSPGRRLHPPTVSWDVQCILTLDHLPVSPMSNVNHPDWQCSANPATSELLSHFYSFPPLHRLHCGRKRRDTRMCYNCNSNVSHRQAAGTLYYITASNFSMKTQAWGSDYESQSPAGLLNSRVMEGFNRSELWERRQQRYHSCWDTSV